MKDNRNKIFEHGECISEDVLLAYVNNKLSTKEKHVVEKHTLGCDMCADALEGITMMKNPAQLTGIVESLNKKIAGAGTERKPIVLWMDTRVRVAIAAGLALLIGFFFLFNGSLNETGNDKTVSDNLKQKGEVADSVSMSLEERSKTDSTEALQQKVAAGKEQDAKPNFKSDSKDLEKSGEVSNKNANNGPVFTTTSHASGGDELRSRDQREIKRNEAPPPPKDDQQQNGSGFSDFTTLDRSKSADDKKVVLQKEKKSEADEKNKETLNGKIASGSANNISNVTVNDPNENVTKNEKLTKHYSDSNTDTPKKEEKDKVAKQDESKRSKKKTTAYAETQKPKEEGIKDGKDHLENTTTPQPNTVVTGGSSGNVSPNMVPQSTTEKEVTLSQNKQLSDDEDSFSRKDTAKFKAQMDSVSTKFGYYGKGEVSGEKKYTDKDYAGAIIIFSKTLETKPTDREALYKLGDSYLHLNKPDQAIIQFDKLIVMGKGSYYDAARYDKSQALLQQNKSAEAKKLLLEIESTSTEYKSRAKVELDKIK